MSFGTLYIELTDIDGNPYQEEVILPDGTKSLQDVVVEIEPHLHQKLFEAADGQDFESWFNETLKSALQEMVESFKT
jgi:hypothetical protein